MLWGDGTPERDYLPSIGFSLTVAHGQSLAKRLDQAFQHPRRRSSPMTISDPASDKVLELKGYGALSGEYAVRKGIDLSKPIAAQAAKVDKKTIAPRKPA